MIARNITYLLVEDICRCGVGMTPTLCRAELSGPALTSHHAHDDETLRFSSLRCITWAPRLADRGGSFVADRPSERASRDGKDPDGPRAHCHANDRA